MLNSVNIVITAGVFLFISGCVQAPTRVATSDDYWLQADETHPHSKAVSLLYYAAYVRDLSGGTDYTQEVEQARLLYAKEQTPFRLLQYVVALTVPGGDIRKAQQLLETFPSAKKSSDPELVVLAQMINADLAERRRLELGTRRAEAESKRADELEKKVEALKNIEKTLSQRDQRSIGNPSAGEKQ